MPTECRRDLFGYEAVEGRQVVAAFDGGQISSNAGALLLGTANRAIGLIRRLAGGFVDGRVPELVEHGVETMLMPRPGLYVWGIALGYEGLVVVQGIVGGIEVENDLVRRIKLAMASACPDRDAYQHAYLRLRRAAF